MFYNTQNVHKHACIAQISVHATRTSKFLTAVRFLGISKNDIR